jgi:hypothetical protein
MDLVLGFRLTNLLFGKPVETGLDNLRLTGLEKPG